MAGVSKNSRYRTAFLMVDIPGYGNSTGHPSPCTIRSAVFQVRLLFCFTGAYPTVFRVAPFLSLMEPQGCGNLGILTPFPRSVAHCTCFQAVKHGIQELIEHHDEDSIILNILGYSLGCAVACSLAADLASAFSHDSMYATPSQATNQQSWTNIATLDPDVARAMNLAASSSRSPGETSFDEGMLSFRDAFNVAMYSKGGVDHVCKIHGWTPSAGYSGIRLWVRQHG